MAVRRYILAKQWMICFRGNSLKAFLFLGEGFGKESEIGFWYKACRIVLWVCRGVKLIRSFMMKSFLTLVVSVFLALAVVSSASAGPTVHGDYTGWAAEAMDAGNNYQY